MIDVIFRGVELLSKGLDKAEFENTRNLNTAFRIEGFRLKNILQKQIRAGSPGGRKFDDLTFVSRYWGGRQRSRRNRPLSRLALGVRYFVPNTSSPRLQVGYVGPVTSSEQRGMTESGFRFSSSGGFRGISIRNMTSKSWRRLASKHQSGFDQAPTDAQRRSAFRSAYEVPRRIKPYFIGAAKKSVWETPARPIIDPFWSQQSGQSIFNIRNNYHKLSAGLKIK